MNPIMENRKLVLPTTMSKQVGYLPSTVPVDNFRRK